jgi:hypothetical protein
MKNHLPHLTTYKYFKSIPSDLRLLRASTLFNIQYYLSYNPNLLKKKINPHLHYLLFGGFVGRDPGPHFDTSWYAATYPEVSHIGLNPLIHYLKIGINKDHATYSSQPGKHIEFLGMNGSGKTTLYFEANNYLNNYLGYYPGPLNIWINMISDVRMNAIGDFPNLFNEYFLENHSFVSDVFTANKQVYGSDYYLPKIPKLKNKYFSILCSYYQAVKSDKAKTWFMFDEGFCSILKRYIINIDGKIDQVLSTRILQQMPKPDLLIYINTDVNLCIKRMRARKTGIPGPYRHISENDFINMLSKGVKTTEQYLDMIQNTGTRTVEINNNGSLENSISGVVEAISTLLE